MILPRFEVFTHLEIGQDYDVTEYIDYGWFGKFGKRKNGIARSQVWRYKPLPNKKGHIWCQL
jgi:hypothetical protein